MEITRRREKRFDWSPRTGERMPTGREQRASRARRSAINGRSNQRRFFRTQKRSVGRQIPFMPERQPRGTGNTEPGRCLEIHSQRQDMRAAGVMMVMLCRALSPIVVFFLRSPAHLMIIAASLGHLAALLGGVATHREDAGVQSGENAEDQQNCEKIPHQRAETGRRCPPDQEKILIPAFEDPRLAGGISGV